MTDLETAAAIALSRLRFYPDAHEEKFVKAMANRGKREWWYDLSRAQKKYLWGLVIKHKNKIGDSALIQEAELNVLEHYQANLF